MASGPDPVGVSAAAASATLPERVCDAVPGAVAADGPRAA